MKRLRNYFIGAYLAKTDNVFEKPRESKVASFMYLPMAMQAYLADMREKN
jgi:hypothetical protein